MFACSIEELKFNYFIQDVSSNYSLNKTAFDWFDKTIINVFHTANIVSVSAVSRDCK